MDPIDFQNNAGRFQGEAARAAQRENSKPQLSAPEQESKASQEVQEQRSAVQGQPLLAVRAGPAPIENLTVNTEDLLRDALYERSSLRSIGDVISVEKPKSEVTPTRTSPQGEATAAQVPERPQLPATEQKRPLGERNEVFSRGEPQNAQPEISAELAQTGTLANEPANQEVVQKAAGTVPVTGAVAQGGDESRRSEPLLGSGGDDSKQGEEAVNAAFTQAGVVEAETQDAIVSRFLGSVPSEDTGPEPQVQLPLGNRAEPQASFDRKSDDAESLSTFA